METVKESKRQRGRPVKPVKKNIRITIRFSEEDYFIVKEKAGEARMKPSVYLRIQGIRGKITPRLTPEERHDVRQLVGISNNINQIVKACHTEGVLSGVLYFEGYSKQIDRILQRFRS